MFFRQCHYHMQKFVHQHICCSSTCNLSFLLNVKTGILDAVPTVAPVTMFANFAEAIEPVAIDAELSTPLVSNKTVPPSLVIAPSISTAPAKLVAPDIVSVLTVAAC